jgi:2-iminobutanoate/2-iminopropanoate deaminase
MSRTQPVRTTDAPAAIGPYNQAVISGDMVYTSGQIALDPVSGKLVGKDVTAQTELVLRNLCAVLAKAGCSAGDVLKTTVYLQDMKDFPAMNAVYAKTFIGVTPARATVAVAALPKGALVEIDAVARRR